MKPFVNTYNIFDLERKRDKLARDGKLKEFKNTYKHVTFGLDEKNTGQFWDNKHIEESKNLLDSPIYKDKLRIVSNILESKKGKLLDVGVGKGYLEKILQGNRKLDLFGVDISQEAIESARAESSGDYRLGNIFQLPYKIHFFDMVIALDVLEHVASNRVFEAYKQIVKVVKRNGLFITSIPLNEGLEEMAKRGENPNGHMRVYTPSIIKVELQISGFNIVNEIYLYAFNKQYRLKSLLLKLIPFQFRQPNLLILVAKKK